MGLISKPFTFSTGATIIASQHNSNFDTIFSDYNGNISDANIVANAAIANNKLSPITTNNFVLGSALYNLATMLSAAGTIPYLNLATISTGMTGTLPTLNGGTGTTASANATNGVVVLDSSSKLPIADSSQLINFPSYSNIVFSFGSGGDSQAQTGNKDGAGWSYDDAQPPSLLNSQPCWFCYNPSTGTQDGYHTVIRTKFKKIAGMSTISVYGYMKRGISANYGTCRITIGSATPLVLDNTGNAGTYVWYNGDITVSGLVDGTVYDVSIDLAVASNSNDYIYLKSIIGIGS